jgi:recombination protein RecA
MLIGQPGIPSGKITTIFGPEGSSKSTLVYHILAETQRMGGIAVLIDSEQRYTRERAKGIGLDPDDLIVIEGTTLEGSFEALEAVIETLRADPVSKTVPITIAYDSLAGSPTEKRLNADVKDVVIGSAAKFVNAELPRLKTMISRESIALVIVNQVRSRISISDPRSYGQELRRKVMGTQHSMIAEWPLLYESALMLRVEAAGPIGPKDAPTGLRVKVSCKKNGLSPREGYSAEVEIDKLHGIDIVESKFQVLKGVGELQESGGWYHFATYPQKKFRKDEFDAHLATHPDLEKVIKDASTAWTLPNEPTNTAIEVDSNSVDGQ